MTYNIKSVNLLENTTSELATTNQNVARNTESIKYILKEIRTNWQNEEGNDIQSLLTELDSCVKTLSNAIVPTVNKYVATMNTLVAESRTTQSRTVS